MIMQDRGLGWKCLWNTKICSKAKPSITIPPACWLWSIGEMEPVIYLPWAPKAHDILALGDTQSGTGLANSCQPRKAKAASLCRPTAKPSRGPCQAKGSASQLPNPDKHSRWSWPTPWPCLLQVPWPGYLPGYPSQHSSCSLKELSINPWPTCESGVGEKLPPKANQQKKSPTQSPKPGTSWSQTVHSMGRWGLKHHSRAR